MSLILLVPFVPEGPGYLISHNDEKGALRSLKKLRGGNYDIEQEFQAIKERKASDQGITTITFRQLFSKSQHVKPFAIVMVLMFLQQFCGAITVVFYVQTIFIEAGSHMDPGRYTSQLSLPATFLLIFPSQDSRVFWFHLLS